MKIGHISLLAVLGLAPLAPANASQVSPNILFILTDDQGYADAGCHGNPVLKTPNIDAFREQSVRFADFCVSSSCSPTRASLLTGRYNLRVGVTHTIEPRCRPTLDVELLPQILRRAGYTTACIGKWHLGDTGPHGPARRGFDFVAGKPAHYQNGKYREDILFDEAMAFMERSAGKPFFCYLATWSPHAPLIVPEKYVAPYRGVVDDTTARFFGMVTNLDENLGRILRWLEEKDLARDTVVVFMNDNGGTYGVDTFNAGMRGCKCTAWTGGTRAMSLWRWPGRWTAHDVDALTAHVDVLPTLAAVAGATPADPTPDGRSLLPLLEGRDDPWFADRMVFQHNARWASGLAAQHKDSMASVRWRNYLLVRSQPCEDPTCITSGVSQCNTLRRVAQGLSTAAYTKNAQFIWGLTPGYAWALYDVRDDPACRNDLTTEKPDVTSRLGDAYGRWWDAIYPEMIAAGGDAPLNQAAVEKAGSRQKK